MTAPIISHELTIILTCCRWPVTAAVRDDLRRHFRVQTDWAHLVQLAQRHRVVGLVYNAIQTSQISPPPEIEAKLSEQSLRIARQNLRAAKDIVQLSRRLEQSGIRPTVLKGLPLAQTAYGTIALKQSRDIDLLVGPSDVIAAVRLLESDGYLLARPAADLTDEQRQAFISHGDEFELQLNGGRMRIELRWRLSENPWLTTGLAEADRESVCLPGGPVCTLGAADLFAYLCVHGAGHAWFRLKWLADLDAFLGKAGDEDIIRYYRHAEAHGGALCAAQGLLLTQKLFGRTLPDRLLHELAGQVRVRWLVGHAMRSILAPEPSNGADEQARQLAWAFLLGRGKRFHLAQCMITLIAPADVLQWVLPKRLSFLYPLIRIPSWLWRRVALDCIRKVRFGTRAVVSRPNNSKSRHE